MVFPGSLLDQTVTQFDGPLLARVQIKRGAEPPCSELEAKGLQKLFCVDRTSSDTRTALHRVERASLPGPDSCDSILEQAVREVRDDHPEAAGPFRRRDCFCDLADSIASRARKVRLPGRPSAGWPSDLELTT